MEGCSVAEEDSAMGNAGSELLFSRSIGRLLYSYPILYKLRSSISVFLS